jgi:cytochrome P450 family 142 subfamily A polypeptide 1
LSDNTCPRWSQDHGGHWVASSHEAVCAIARDAETFSSAQGVHVPPTGLYKRGIRIFALEHDDPEHWDQRQVLAEAVGSKPSAVRRELVVECLKVLLAGIEWSKPVDLVEALTNPLPLDVIFAVMGADPEFKPEMKALVDALLKRVAWSPELGDPAERVHDIARTMVERRRAQPRADWITDLATTSVCGRLLTIEEQVDAVVSLITGGHHSTSRGLASLFARVLTEPGLQKTLVAEPGLISAAIEETLRLHTPLPEFSRTAVADATVLEVHVVAEAKVQMLYAEANRDPAVFDEPEQFRLDRRRAQHLAFGYGPHRCVGTHLARAQMELALVEVLRRAPELQLVEPVTWLGPAEPTALVVRACATQS